MSEASDLVAAGRTLAVIGGGVMGEAIVAGLLAAGTFDASSVTIAEPRAERRAELEAAHRVNTVAKANDALPADVVLLAVKPQVIGCVVAEIAAQLADSTVVSIAAGVSCARLESWLPEGTAVVRVMPNMPAMVRQGMAIVSGGTDAADDDLAIVTEMFTAIGETVVLEERYQDAATAISGSGPAYFALVIDALARAGVAQGLPRSVAEALAIQTMRGTAAVLAEKGTHPGELIDGVSSPGGTTIAAISRLEAGGVRASFADAVAAAVARAKELGN